ncbi:MAG: hypothetical protein MUD12_06510 [Spirochaetes bacterium]|jgi:hypothetical protein|nr:hypothetical protein [Spirochaetota bacterium]
MSSPAYIPFWTAVPLLAGLFCVYLFFSRKRWLGYIAGSCGYHAGHFDEILSDPASDDRSREISRNMIWMMKNHLSKKISGEPHGRGPGHGSSSLRIIGETYARISQYGWKLDPRIIKLLNTLMGTAIRLNLIRSPMMFLALPALDIMLLFSHTGFPGSGTGRLFRDISSGKI